MTIPIVIVLLTSTLVLFFVVFNFTLSRFKKIHFGDVIAHFLNDSIDEYAEQKVKEIFWGESIDDMIDRKFSKREILNEKIGAERDLFEVDEEEKDNEKQNMIKLTNGRQVFFLPQDKPYDSSRY